MHSDLLIIIPCYNEVQSIRGVITDLRLSLGRDTDIVVIDDCSTDGTSKLLAALDVITITLPFNLGYSGALQTGYKYAFAHGYELVLQFDADGQHLASEIQKLLNARKQTSADIVIGSRFVESGGSHESFLKRIATSLFCKLIRIITGEIIHDPTSGFQLLNRRALEQYITIHNFPYYPDANIIIEMILNGFSVKEVQVTMRDRQHGSSMHSGLLRQSIYMATLFYSIFIIVLKYIPSKFSHKAR